MDAIKIEINLDALGYMTVDGLKEHLSRVENSEKILKEHIAEVKGRIIQLNVSEYEAKWPFKKGQLVKVTYEPFCNGKQDVKIGYFLRFENVFLVLSNVKNDGTMGKRITDILAKSIVNIEPYEIPYSK